jgi:L-ascorbate metabolism protein UlaG (beta-lactamase superfamily)
MKIRFVNHSGFIVEYKGKKIMVDPWLEGMVFLNAWKQHSPTLFTYEEFADIDYIRFSHEHPDHFYPPNLKKISPQHKSKITILFQDTIDKRVADYCANAGFKSVIELKKNTFLDILPDFQVMCEHFAEGDSWICFKTPDQTLLNVNDCGIGNKSSADEILTKIGKVDILMTQFSYAFWAGNPEDKALRQSYADDKLQLVKSQIEFFRPKVTIPIASYVYFCHKDNRHLNDLINTSEKVYRFIKENTDTEPVILYNNETYTYPEQHDSQASIHLYQEDLRRVLNDDSAFVSKYETVSKEEVSKAADAFVLDMQKNNSFLIKRALRKANVYITDWNESYALSLDGFQKTNSTEDNSDVIMSSDLLLFCLKFPFGLDTVQISGRFRKPHNGNYNNFYNLFRINHLKMRGIDPNSPGTIAGIAMRRILTKVGLNKDR